jgi:flagellar assembly factor FliW
VTDTELAWHDDDAPILTFPAGIPGFPAARRFTLQQLVEDSAFQLLDSVSGDGVSMVVAQPWLFFPDYAPVIADQDQQELALERPEDAVVFCPVSIDREAQRLYINLRGPLLVNIHTRVGRQCVLEEDLPLRAVIELDVD